MENEDNLKTNFLVHICNYAALCTTHPPSPRGRGFLFCYMLTTGLP